MSFTDQDQKWMQRALKLAKKGAGYVAPNPLVGCVIVSKYGRKIGEGYHERYGEAHAEINALNSIKDKSDLDAATVYVTLEPCAHQGKTPPCADELAKWPLKRVVIATKDPTPKVNGRGIARLRKAGIKVETRLMEEEAKELNRFFFHFQELGIPYVTLKIAQTADGYIAAPDGSSQWITSKPAREKVHSWRSIYDAVMVGRHTAQIDNPRLTVRHVEGRQPRRIVVDGPYELSPELHLLSDQYEEKTIRITHNKQKASDEADPMLSLLKSNYFRGKTLLVPELNGHTHLEETLRKLGDMNISSILVEAGPELATAMLKNDLVDQMELFVAPKLLGGGTRSIQGLGIDRMSDVRPFRSHRWQQIGDDLLLTAYL